LGREAEGYPVDGLYGPVAELKNEFSWSWSRHRAFQRCLRQYYLLHYGSWGGWDATSPAREVYVQKKLNSRAQWLGIAVHEAAEWVLNEVRRGHFPSPDRLVERTLRRGRIAIEESRAGMYRFNPKRSPGFVDHYYGLEPGEEAWAADLVELERQVRGLFENRVFLRLARVPERIREVERLETLRVEDVPVYVSLDVLVSDGDGGFVIIDWKTGKEHDSETVVAQLGVYGLYVFDRYFRIPPSASVERPVGKVTTMYVNLRTGHHEVHQPTDEVLVGTVEVIRTSAQAMRERLADRRENIAREDDFPRVDAGHPACTSCAFRRTCGRE